MRRRLSHFGPSMWVIACLAVSHFENVQAQNNNCSKDTSVGELVSVEYPGATLVKSSNNNLEKGVRVKSPDGSTEGLIRIIERLTSQNSKQEDRYICPGDEITVGAASRASLFMSEPKSVLRLDENTIFQVKSPITSDYKRTHNETIKPELISFTKAIKYCHETINKTWLNLKQGAVHLFTTQPQKLNINTQYMNASVEGTEFVVRANDAETEVTVIDGTVGVCNDNGNAVIENEQRAVSKGGSAPKIFRQLVKPKNAVQWALYYPLLVEGEDKNKKILDAYKLANLGQTEEAITLLNEEPNDAYTLALKSTIAIVQAAPKDNSTEANQDYTKEANILAEDALKKDHNSVPAWLAKSYVQQARFELPEAQKSVEMAKGVINKVIKDGEANDQLKANYALILSRLAELQLSNDDKKGAQQTADLASKQINELVSQSDEQTAQLKSISSRVKTVNGFIELSHFEIKKAKDSFFEATQDDETNPLPHLGLGLAQIRKDKLEEGKRNIEIAVSLDPGNSLFRSYLGKTYFEDSKDRQAEEQLALAEEFDPNDPTPDLYSAFLNQSINRPTQALKDLQKAIEKNDNRAVYRSRLGLDEDLATQSASTARIYDELGFDQLTVLEGAKALAQDPGNYSAHRLMADAYLNLPRHEIARVSELLQSQIRQPLNNNPAQVQLADSKLGAFRDSGPFDVSFNEFSRLYTKEGFSRRGGVVVGENGTHGEEVQVSNLTGNNSFTLTGYNFETDGGRENADEDNELLNFFVQHQLTNRTSLQAEYRNINIDKGETFIGLDRQDFDPNLRIDEDISSYRFGVFHQVNSNNELIINYRKEDFDQKFDNLDFGPEQEVTRANDIENKQLEALYSKNLEFNGKQNQIVLGAGRVNQDRLETVTEDAIDLFTDNAEIDHNNYYLYLYPKLNNTEVTIGFSYDDYEDSFLNESELNTKFGLVYSGLKSTNIRIAAFESFKRTLVGNQTLEPTNIAGFNQFYDDANGARIKNYAIGIDHNLRVGQNANEIFLGIEGFKRKLDVPFLDFDFDLQETFSNRDDIEERGIRAYSYFPYKNWSFGIKYEKEIFDRKFLIEGPEQIVDLRTHRVSLRANYFSTNGYSISLMPTYISQKGDLITRFFDEYSDSDSFWVFDLNIGKKFHLDNSIKGDVSLNINNLFDEDFNFQDTDPFNSRFDQGRTIFMNISLDF